MKIDITDDFLDQKDLENIQNLLLGPDFPWFFNNSINNPVALLGEDNSEQDISDFQFVHTFYLPKNGYQTVHSNFFNCLLPILDKLQIKVLYRIKANLLTPTSTHRISGYHTDMPDILGSTTGIFYVNSNNGLTSFDNNEKVESIANRMVAFPSRMLHSGVSCTNCKHRVVINFNYF